MRFVRLFDLFLRDTVNLNQSRIDVAENGRKVVGNWLQQNELFGQYFIDVSPQGSYRQGTIIKPAFGDTEFDVDVLFDMKAPEGWEPCDYLEKLHKEFKKTKQYEDIVDKRGKTRCVTLDYESDFHIDIVPSIATSTGRVIFNRKTNQDEVSDGEGYAAWFESRSAVCTKKRLVKVVRLVKYLRAKHKLDAKSILLTTLLASQVYDTDDCDKLYCDIPTSLYNIVGRLNAVLQRNPIMIRVTNPVLPSEDFNRHWSQEKYEVFRKKFNEIATDIRDAYELDDTDESWERWVSVFGDDFPDQSTTAKAYDIVKHRISSVVNYIRAYPSASEQWIDHTYGFRIAPTGAVLRIDAKVDQKGYRSFWLSKKRFPLKRRKRLEFCITHSTAPNGTVYYWKVRNAGEEAKNKGQLRGEITQDQGQRRKVENTLYPGLHFVECYAIYNRECIAIAKIEVPISDS